MDTSSALSARVIMEGVERRFPGTGAVVTRLDLTIEPGEFVSLLGPSGCGKSTLLRMIAGLDEPDGGEITVGPAGAGVGPSSGARCGFVFQEAHLLPWRTVIDNVALPLELMGHPRVQARIEAREAVARVGLAEAMDKHPNELSGGMKMRVSVARALVTRPSLLLLDEPFAALDENTRHRLQEQLRFLWESLRMTVVFVTHSVSEAIYLSNRSLVFSRRPARVVLDRAIILPESRPARIRTDSRFTAEVERIGTAFEDSGLTGAMA